MFEVQLLSKDGKSSLIDKSQIVTTVIKGGIVRLKFGLQKTGIFDEIKNATFTSIHDLFGEDILAKIEQTGLEKIHDSLDPNQLEKLWKEIYARTHKDQLRYCKLIGKAMGIKRGFWIQHAYLIRLFIPHDERNKNEAIFKSRNNLGRLELQSPHHDYWYSVPTNTINLWMAVGRVRKNNGMGIFTDLWGQNVPRDGAYVSKSQPLGKPLLIECEPGDIIVFDGRHMHSSILNTSNETRYVITSRILVDTPVPYTAGELEKKYYYSSLIGTKWERYSGNIYQITPFYLREKLRYLIFKLFAKGPRILNPFKRLFRYSPDKNWRYKLPKHLENSNHYAENVEEIQESQIAAVDTKYCVTRIDGKLFGFERWCPHEGADLSCGYISNGKVYCPWHNYPIDPISGEGACHSLRTLKTFNPAE